MSLRSILPRASALLAAFAALPLGAAVARAEAVVIATTAPGVAVGGIVADDSPLTVPAGAEVTLLGADGVARTVKGPGRLAAAAPAGGADPGVLDTLSSLVAEPREVERFGAVRGGCPRPAGNPARAIADLAENGCAEAALARLEELRREAVPPALSLTSAGGDRPYRLGEPIRLRLQASFDAHLYCYHYAADGTATQIFPFEPSKGTALRANRPLDLPNAATRFRLVAAEPVGTDRLGCFATERDVAAPLAGIVSPRAGAILPPDAVAGLAPAFAGAGGRTARAETEIAVAR